MYAMRPTFIRGREREGEGERSSPFISVSISSI